MEIRRYRPHIDLYTTGELEEIFSKMFEIETGEFVKFTDHESALAEEREKAKQKGKREAIEEVWGNVMTDYEDDSFVAVILRGCYKLYGGNPDDLKKT